MPRIPELEQSHPWAVYFPPDGGATKAIVDALGLARETVLVQADSVGSAPIANALVAAHRRGAKVEVLLDGKIARARPPSARLLARAGIRTLLDGAHAIADKVMVIDGQVVITGSFSFAAASERPHAANLLVMHDPSLAARYTENWRLHAAHSTPYSR